ncbi:MAG: helix-turn-helix transcriptional regulator, partial [Pseudomonadota bacterium]|nr:helix-turn-helix transcriptional regulator [Pseudomonadota bacterium]
ARKSRLSQWLDRIRDTPLSQHSHFLDGCRVPRSGSHSHYIVQCSALGSQEEWDLGGGQFHYVAFITDPAALKLPREERLMQLYGLTQMQARVALAFAGGATYKNVARSLRISEETVRSHVKEIYPKTRVNRQADLVRLVLSLGQSGI